VGSKAIGLRRCGIHAGGGRTGDGGPGTRLRYYLTSSQSLISAGQAVSAEGGPRGPLGDRGSIAFGWLDVKTFREGTTSPPTREAQPWGKNKPLKLVLRSVFAVDPCLRDAIPTRNSPPREKMMSLHAPIRDYLYTSSLSAYSMFLICAWARGKWDQTRIPVPLCFGPGPTARNPPR